MNEITRRPAAPASGDDPELLELLEALLNSPTHQRTYAESLTSSRSVWPISWPWRAKSWITS